ncbi:MAG: adhesin, partial [Erysipelotrichaceae bacterium]
IFITCNKDGELYKRAAKEKNCYAINLTEETHDKSFAMTSSFSNMMLAALLCFNLDNLEEIKKDMDDVITSAKTLL